MEDPGNKKIHHILAFMHTQSCLSLCNPVDCSPPGSSVHGILQARALEWVAVSCTRGSSRPKDDSPSSLASPCTGKQILFPTEPPGKPLIHLQMEIHQCQKTKLGRESNEGGGGQEEAGKSVQVESLWVENVSRELNGGGIEIIWGQVIPGRKEGRCKVMAVGLRWACSRKAEQNPVAGTDGAEESVKDELRGGASYMRCGLFWVALFGFHIFLNCDEAHRREMRCS